METVLGVPEKDFRKCICFCIILPLVKSLSEISLQPLVEQLKKEGRIIQ